MSKNNIILAGCIVTAFTLLGGWYFGFFTQQSVVVEEPVKTRMIKIIKTYKDVAAAPLLDTDAINRALTLLEVPAGTQILSVVTNVTEEFRFANGDSALLYALRARIDGQDVSAGDIGAPMGLNSVKLNNQLGSAQEIGLYSLEKPVEVVAYIHGDNDADLANLRSGVLEVYITVVLL